VSSGQPVTLLGSLDPAARALLLDRLGQRALIVTKSGLAVDRERLLSEMEILSALEPAESSGATEVPATPPAPPAPRLPIALAPLRRRRSARAVPLRLCDVALAEQRLTSADRKQVERRRMLEVLVEHPFKQIPRARARHLTALESLRMAFPNFAAVVDQLQAHLALAVRLRQPMHLPPMLLQGPPGIGKTAFVLAVAKALDFHLLIQSFAEVTAGFVITGNAANWADSAPGCVARVLVDAPNFKSPLILIDELDKTESYGRHPPDRSLLGVLEPVTSSRFRDEHLDLELDASAISWLFTSNRLDKVRPEILSRLEIIEVSPPHSAQMPAIVRSVDASIRKSKPALSRVFHPLSADLVKMLSRETPRDLHRRLIRAYARGVVRQPQERGRLSLSASDLEATADTFVAPRPAAIHLPASDGALTH
jgi:ATP-dependent Lon protease